MAEQEEKKEGIQRYPISSHRTSSVLVIGFETLIPIKHVVRINNLSVAGVGIESNEPIRPGLVYFQEPIGGQKFGLITWCRHNGIAYRAGINFVTLSQKQEQYLLKQLKLRPPHIPLQDPKKIIASLFQTFKNQINQ